MKGLVRNFDEKKGFGFITVEDGSDIFVHSSGIEREDGSNILYEGEAVTFEVESGSKGSHAKDVRPAA